MLQPMWLYYGEKGMKVKMEFFDSHAHLNDEKFTQDLPEVICQICEAQVTRVISAGYSLASSKKSIQLAREYDFIYSTCGISPNDIPQSEEELWKMLEEIQDLAQNHVKVIAIGEIGLDYYWEKDEKRRKLQQKAFEKQIKLANALSLPIVIHTRDAMIDTIRILQENPVNQKGVFHCCPQNQELIREALALGFFISFAGPITFKNAKHANEIIETVPLDRLFIETDSPYLAPEPVRGRRNTPANVPYIAQKIAEVKQISLEEVAKQTYQNANKLYHLH